MGSPCVVEPDVSGQSIAGGRDAIVGTQVALFVFDGPPEPFDEDVIAPCAFAIHADLDVSAVLSDECELVSTRTVKLSLKPRRDRATRQEQRHG